MIPLSSVRCTTLLLAMAAPLASLRAQEQELTDRQICEAIEDELSLDAAIQPSLITIDASEGIVTLTGRTGNLLASERAAAVARTVRGVAAVVNRVAVAPDPLLPADELRASIERALLEDPATDSYEVRVLTTDAGKVTLRGKVESWAECDLCATVAKGVAGVTAIDNQIAVEPPTVRPDHEIEKEVAQRLHWDILIDGELIDVKCEAGQVTLDGFVGSAAERFRAESLAHVAGCKQVDASKVETKEWARNERMRGSKYAVRSEDQIQAAVEAAMLRDPRVSSFKVKPIVSNDLVTLYGTVDNLKARRAAESDARNTVGVARVINRLRVDSGLMRSSEEIAQDVRAALQRAPYVDRPAITVAVHNGVVKLYGSVDSSFERACADDAVARVPGVVDVDNNLAVLDDSIVPFDPYVDDWPIHAYPWYRYTASLSFRDDDEVRKEIESELWWSPYVDSEDVNVDVHEGKAVLTGIVDSRTERECATENAYDGGAVWVVNKLKIRKQADEELPQGDQ